MRVFEPFEFKCTACGALLKPDDSMGLFFCPECRKIYDAGINRHLAKESKYYRNTLRKSAPDVFTVAVFSYYESTQNIDERAAAAALPTLEQSGDAQHNRGLFRARDVIKPNGFCDELLRKGEQIERQRKYALGLISSVTPESKRGGSPLAAAYESYVADLKIDRELREAVELSEEMYCRGASFYNERYYAEAVKDLTASANMGHVKANYLLAMCYVKGYGVEKDVYTALHFMRKAAEQGDQDAQFELGMIYGNARLGVKDTRESAKWLRRAGEQGDKRAQGILGVYYLNGIGVPQSDANAVLWVRKAAAQGFAEAQCMLGAVYADGRGVNKNVPEARVWYNKAIAQGNKLAEQQLRSLERELAEARRRREQAQASSSYGGTRSTYNSYNRNTSSSYNRQTGGNSYSQNSYNRNTSTGYNRTPSSQNNYNRTSSGGTNKINWVIFVVLLFFFPLGAIIYAFVSGNKTAKTVIGVILGIIIFLAIIIAAANSCAYNVAKFILGSLF